MSGLNLSLLDAFNIFEQPQNWPAVKRLEEKINSKISQHIDEIIDTTKESLNEIINILSYLPNNEDTKPYLDQTQYENLFNLYSACTFTILEGDKSYNSPKDFLTKFMPHALGKPELNSTEIIFAPEIKFNNCKICFHCYNEPSTIKEALSDLSFLSKYNMAYVLLGLFISPKLRVYPVFNFELHNRHLIPNIKLKNLLIKKDYSDSYLSLHIVYPVVYKKNSSNSNNNDNNSLFESMICQQNCGYHHFTDYYRNKIVPLLDLVSKKSMHIISSYEIEKFLLTNHNKYKVYASYSVVLNEFYIVPFMIFIPHSYLHKYFDSDVVFINLQTYDEKHLLFNILKSLYEFTYNPLLKDDKIVIDDNTIKKYVEYQISKIFIQNQNSSVLL